jgi:hypothetical protein
MKATMRIRTTAQSIVMIQYAHCHFVFQMMKEATKGPR